MTTFRLNLVFHGVDFDDDAVFEALAEHPHILWRAQGKTAHATAVVEAGSALKAAGLVSQQVLAAVPSARPLVAEEDLVCIPDVASRIGMTREAVRNWADGRRQAGFPLPRGVVGDGIKVWAWADVNAWLRTNLGIGDDEAMATQHDIAMINAFFRQEASPLPMAEETLIWSVANRVSTSTETTVTQIASSQRWLPARTETKLLVIDGGVSAAA